jgi:DNA-binding NarL/FixJ family response regulator
LLDIESARQRHRLVSLSQSTQIRLFIIDAQPLIAAALHHLFVANGPFEVVGTDQLVTDSALRGARPDVVVLCQDHGATGICDMIEACRSAAPAAKVCVVACHLHPELLPRVMEAGADGFTVKDMAPAEFLDAIVHIYRGGTYVDARMGAYLPVLNGSARRVRTLNALSARETEVLRLIADGYSNREISIALSLSEKTIKNHISRIFAKLHITARTQAVIHAIKSGIA